MPITSQKSISSRARGKLLFLSLIWGGSFLSIRVALNEVPVVTSVLFRTGLSDVALWFVVLVTKQPVPRNPGNWGAFLIMGCLNNVIPFGLMAWGQLHIETGLTSIPNAATAIFAVLVAAMVFPDEKLTARKTIGIALGFLGVATAVGVDSFAKLDLRSSAQIAVLSGAASYAFAAAWARATLGHLPPQVAVTGILSGSTLILLPAALLIDGPINLTLQPVTWIAITYYALVATAGAYLLYYRVLTMAGSGNLMLVTLLIPPVAIPLGALMLDESLNSHAFAGFGILAMGLLILNGTLFKRRD